MQVKPDSLAQYLQRNPNWHLALVSGDEPFLVLDAEKELKQTLNAQGIEETIVFDIDAKFNWGLFDESVNSISLFSSKKLIQLRFANKIDASAQKILQAYVSKINPDVFVIIRCPKLDTSALKSVWLGNLDKNGLIIVCYPPTYDRLPQFIQARAKSKQLVLDNAAIEFLAAHDEGNLLAIEQELDRLKLLFGSHKVSLEEVQSVIADNAKFNIFDFTDAVLNGDFIRIKRILDTMRLEGEEPIVINFMLQKEISILLNMHVQKAQGASMDQVLSKVWRNKQALYQKALQRSTLKHYQAFLETSIIIDRAIKGNFKENPWNALLRLSFALAGKKILSLSASVQ